MLEINQLSAHYGAIQAVENASLKLEEKQIVSIIGANGAGKSTLMKCVSGLHQAKTGQIRFLGQAIEKLPCNAIVKKGISHVLEGRQLFAHLTVEDNLNLGAYLEHFGAKRKEVPVRLEEVYHLFPRLKERRSQISGTLSGGEQQMLAIGRALMAKPKLLILDEPSLGLAPKIVHNIFEIILDLNRQGSTILLVEQNAKLALGLSHYAYVMETGRITLHGTGKELLTNDLVQKAYLGSS